MMARDGEGASKYFETVVSGALNEEDARLAAKAVARSSLVKTAVYGADPNWGRIICAVGYSGAEMDPTKITLGLEGKSPMEQPQGLAGRKGPHCGWSLGSGQRDHERGYYYHQY